MRIIFLGTPDFAAQILQALLSTDAEIVAVVTQPDKPVGRKATPVPTPVKALAQTAGIPVLQPSRLRAPEVAGELRALTPDLIVVAAYGQIIPAEILQIPPLGCVNVHASLLPRYRGAAPIQWALLQGEEKTGVSLMQMDEGLDTGAVLATREVEITAEETGESLFQKLAAAGGALLVENLSHIRAKTLKAIPQPADSPTAYARMIRKEDGRIIWEHPAAQIERQIRALTPWPSAYTTLDGKRCKIWKAAVAKDETNRKEHDTIETQPGMWLAADDGTLLVQTGEGILRILALQLEGKKRLSAEEFLRGRPYAAGMIFQ